MDKNFLKINIWLLFWLRPNVEMQLQLFTGRTSIQNTTSTLLHNSACQEAGKETFGDAFFCTSVTRSYEGKLASCLAISYTVQCSKSLKVSVFHSYFGSAENRKRSSLAQPSLLVRCKWLSAVRYVC